MIHNMTLKIVGVVELSSKMKQTIEEECGIPKNPKNGAQHEDLHLKLRRKHLI